jgi:hypothetical protein
MYTILIPLVFTPMFTATAFEDGSVRVQIGNTAVGACVRSELGCTPDDNEPPFTFFEDGSVRMTIEGTVVSFCA